MMRIVSKLKSQRGGLRLRIGDVITVLILLAILLYASYRQFPVYNLSGGAPAPAAKSSPGQ